MISPEEFWINLESSGFLPSEQIRNLRGKIERKESIAQSTVKIARALVSNRILTEEQAKSLLSVKDKAVAPTPIITEASSPASENEVPNRTVPVKLISLAVVAAGAIGITGWMIWSLVFPSDPVQQQASPASSPVVAPVASTEPESPYEFSDAEDSLWARRLPGKPLTFFRLPLDTQMIVRVRMTELLEHPSGTGILRSLGPGMEQLLQTWTSKLGVEPNELEQLTLFLLPQGTTTPQVIAEGHFATTAMAKLAALGSFDGQRTLKLATNGIWCPTEDENVFYYGPMKQIEALRAQEDDGFLRRELTHLLRETHDTDTISMLANPNFLQDEAKGLFSGERQRLLSGLFDFWSDEAQAVCFGFQQSDIAFAEVRMIARDDLRPKRLMGRVNRYLESLPSKVGDFLGVAELDPHWQPLAMRFPTMVSFMTEQTRIAVERKQVALTAVLPVEATHNLLLASELSLATPVRETSVASKSNQPKTIEEVLDHVTSVRFAQKSLDEAMRDITQQIQEELRSLPFAFEIEIIGGDLEPEGITRNQQIRGFDASNVSLSKTLTQLVMKANPDQSVTSAADQSQKLVWVADPSRPGKIVITTRNAAKQKQFELSADFR